MLYYSAVPRGCNYNPASASADDCLIVDKTIFQVLRPFTGPVKAITDSTPVIASRL